MVQPPGPAELEAAGLYEPEADDASSRLALLEYLISLGATLEELTAAEPDELPGLASTITLWANREMLTSDEVAAAAGVEPSLVVRAWRAVGLPAPAVEVTSRMFSQRDVELVQIIGAGIELLGEDVTIQLLRVIGSAAARVADATVSAFIVNVASPAVEADPSGLQLARANAESLLMLDGVARGFDTLLRHHIQRGFRRDVSDTLSGVDLVRRSVGFADLVDSTAWTQQLDLRVLAHALTRFDATASEIVVGHGGLVVKLIGDEVMFVAHDPAAAVDIGLALINAFASDDELPAVRVGITTGDVLARDGDYSGPIVNLAARAVKLAAPSTLLVDQPTRDAIHDVSSLSCAEPHAHVLKGFADQVALSQVTSSANRR
ncbi:MAG TPA: adenylate cyclase regulatory domain-containing protein [Acidimicrobiia bacterium]|nr:adenylate cyclase regulatory domain-containing protein [Acidimicrobiia bacterium]